MSAGPLDNAGAPFRVTDANSPAPHFSKLSPEWGESYVNNLQKLWDEKPAMFSFVEILSILNSEASWARQVWRVRLVASGDHWGGWTDPQFLPVGRQLSMAISFDFFQEKPEIQGIWVW